MYSNSTFFGPPSILSVETHLILVVLYSRSLVYHTFLFNLGFFVVVFLWKISKFKINNLNLRGKQCCK